MTLSKTCLILLLFSSASFTISFIPRLTPLGAFSFISSRTEKIPEGSRIHNSFNLKQVTCPFLNCNDTKGGAFADLLWPEVPVQVLEPGLDLTSGNKGETIEKHDTANKIIGLAMRVGNGSQGSNNKLQDSIQQLKFQPETWKHGNIFKMILHFTITLMNRNQFHLLYYSYLLKSVFPSSFYILLCF